MTDDSRNVKAMSALEGGGKSAFRRYRNLCYGTASLWYVLKSCIITGLASSTRGPCGLFLRSRLYPCLFRKTGRKVLFGRNLVLRHAHKISLGDNVIVDDNCVLDAKGDSNAGITIGNNVYIGRNSIVYCKNGDIKIGDRVNISANCTVFSSNDLTMADGTVVGAYSYLLSGGEYDYTGNEKFCEQTGMVTRGPLRIGSNCWIGARVTVLDNASIGDDCVIGAGAVVTKAISEGSLAAGVPAKVIKPTGFTS
jgi:acetyltransferase-like isoleucine patch superfamily enzyme